MKHTMSKTLLVSMLAAAYVSAGAQTVRIGSQGDALSMDPHSFNETVQLSVTGNVASQRQISGAISDLLFDILTRLRKEGIVLSTPQTMIIERRALPATQNEGEALP